MHSNQLTMYESITCFNTDIVLFVHPNQISKKLLVLIRNSFNQISRPMRNTIGLKTRPSIIDRALVLRPLRHIEPILDSPTPPPPLQVHIVVPISLEPPFSILVPLVLLPRLGELEPLVRRPRQDSEERGKTELVVAAEEHVGLVRVRGGQANEEVDDLAGVWPTVAVVAEEDDERGLEVLWVDLGLEVGPEALKLVDVAVDVANAAHHLGLGAGF